MKLGKLNIIYENKLPQLCSRQAVFPFLTKCRNNRLAAVYVVGEAFESVDQTSYISFSDDNGATWSDPKKLFDKSDVKIPYSDCCKASLLPDGKLLAIGYAFYREDTKKPIGNPETGGLLDDFVFYSISDNNGITWSKPKEIKCVWGNHVEASAPPLVLSNGTIITPITGFPDWDGNITGETCGRALISYDNANTWNDDTICMNFDRKLVI